MATVDIIVPLYNKEDTIERTIRSVQNQTFSDWTLIIVDDGSTDGGPDRVGQLND
ncbi:MAG: glycosyltransferase family 2 protein, partial [Planctomycetota bacterium]